MSNLDEQITKDMKAITEEWIKKDYLRENDRFVIGCSTSEVVGEAIGTSGSEETAERIYAELRKLKEETGVHLLFQCCEHLNRALVMERETFNSNEVALEEVTAIPHPTAGGSMASYAYKQMKDPVLVEEVRADAGIDIGDTMIGMQLKRVVIPLRFKQQMIGNARITGARTRPKLIGGKRAKYD